MDIVSYYKKDDVIYIRVSGRATFECAADFRSFANELTNLSFSSVKIDFSSCTWMDSTCMGVLAIIALCAKKKGVNLFAINISEQNRGLLCGLGLKKFFTFCDEPFPGDLERFDFAAKNDDGGNSVKQNAHTILDAHKTLMDVDEANVKKFGKVVDLVQRDLDKISGSGN